MAQMTVPKQKEEETEPAAGDANKSTPGLVLGAGLGAASGLLAITSGDAQLLAALGASGVAGGWAALGTMPGPWRWLPGQGEPWEWMCRASRRRYRRAVKRMRRRLPVQPEQQAPDGLMVPVVGIADGWHQREDRAVLVRDATAAAHRKRVAFLRSAWERALPNWQQGWWRRYSLNEMALRAGPLAALPAAGYVEMPWPGRVAVVAAGAAWGRWVWNTPDPATPREPRQHGADWYQARWDEWIACERGPLPGSRLAGLDVTEDVLTAVIVSTTARPADTVTRDAVSIAFEVPPRAVNIHRAGDMAASRAKLTVRLKQKAIRDGDLVAEWEEHTSYSGSQVLPDSVKETPYGRQFVAEFPRKGSRVTDADPQTIAQNLSLEGEDAASRLALRPLGARHLEVRELTRSPLQDGVPFDLAALRMDSRGRVVIGRDLYGNPVEWRLLDIVDGRFGMDGGQGVSAVHSFVSGTTGSGKTSLEEALLIAQRANGFISWVADGKGGVGYASWTHDLDWLVSSPLGFKLMGQAAVRVGEYRFAEQKRMSFRDGEGNEVEGRSFFVPGEPWRPLQATWDEFNEMAADGMTPAFTGTIAAVSKLGRQTRAAGIAARIDLQIPNLDFIGSDKNAQAVRRMLQSGNIALFRSADWESIYMALGNRAPEMRVQPVPPTFPDGSGTGGVGYVADDPVQFPQMRVMYSQATPIFLAREVGPLESLTDPEADVAGIAYQLRDEYRGASAEEEEEFLRDLLKKEEAKNGKNTKVFDMDPTPAPAPAEDVEDEDLDEIAPLSRSQKIWFAVDGGARRNKTIAQVTDLKPTNVAGGTKRLERLGKLHQVDLDWHTADSIDA